MAIATQAENLFHTHQLPNGLQLLGQYMPDVQSAACVFYVLTGTRDERPEIMGVSHFLEHMAFRRTEHFSGEEIDHAFEAMGAEHNAATGREMTLYWARVLSEHVPQAIEVLGELTHPVLDKSDFDQERNVILEEIARYDDIPSHILFSTFMQHFFPRHPLALETLGTPETVRALTVEQMRNYWAQRYGTRNLIFSIAGNFDWDAVIKEVGDASSSWQAGEAGRVLTPAAFSPGLHVEVQEKFTQEQILIGVPSVSGNDRRYYTAHILAAILGDDTGSRLYWALNHTGLAESATASVMDFDDNGVMFVHLATEPSLVGKALDVARQELARLQEFDIQQDELERAKAKLNSSVVIGGESTNERVMSLIRAWTTEGKLETLDEVRRKIEVVTLDDLHALLRDFPVSPDQVITAVGSAPQNEFEQAL